MRTGWRGIVGGVDRWLACATARSSLCSRVGLLSLAALTSTGLALAGTPTSAASTTAARNANASVVKELPQLRTATSDTYLLSNGLHKLLSYPHPINYQPKPGQWAPIDDRLSEGEGGTWHPVATGVPVSLPASLATGPVSVGPSGRSIGLSLEGASALSPAQTSGSEGRYEQSMPEVSSSYSVGSTSLRETLTLQSPMAPTEYHYSLSMSPGLNATLTSAGAVDIIDRSGNVAYRLPAPTVRDSASGSWPQTEPVHYALSADGHTLSVVLSGAWLHSQGRVFPVRIDPDIYYGLERDCVIQSGKNAKTSLCGQPLLVGSNSETPRAVSRTLVDYELSPALPKDDVVLGASVDMKLTASPSSKLTVQAEGLERSFTSEATWDTYDGAHAWTHEGGDYSAFPIGEGKTQPYGEKTLESFEVGYYTNTGATQLVQKWVSEPSSNHGVIVKAKEENTGVYDEFSQSGGEEGGPFMEVIYAARLGNAPGTKFSSIRIDDRASVAVNLANGNAFLSTNELGLPDLELSVNFNTMDSGNQQGMGLGWDISADTHLNEEAYEVNEDMIVHDQTGQYMVFTREPSADKEGNKAYLSPPGVNATLVVHENNSRTLTYNETGLKYEFEPGDDEVDKIVDSNKTETEFEYGEHGEPTKITDTSGHVLKLCYEGYEHELSGMEDELGQKWKFTQDSEQELTNITDPDGQKLQFKYNGAGQLVQITNPEGKLIELSYAAEEYRAPVTKIEGPESNGDKGPWEYTYYEAGKAPAPCTSTQKAIVATSLERGGLYCSNQFDEVEKTLELKPPVFNAFEVTAFDESATSPTQLYFNGAADPPLPDGSPGPDMITYSYRYSVNGGAFTEWAHTEATEVEVPHIAPGATVAIEVYATDSQGNVSAIATTSTVVPEMGIGVEKELPGETGNEGPEIPEPAAKSEEEDPGGYKQTPCSGSGPCGAYKGWAAAQYAEKWRTGRNFEFEFFAGGGRDCTNFVSQALHNGGMKFMRSHEHNSTNQTYVENLDKIFLRGYGAWWSYFEAPENENAPEALYTYEVSFIRAEKLYEHLLNFGLGRIINPNTEALHPGDIIFYDLEGPSLGASALDHTQIVTKPGPQAGVVMVAQHSPGYEHSLGYVVHHKIEPGLGPRGGKWNYVIVRPIHTTTNLYK